MGFERISETTGGSLCDGENACSDWEAASMLFRQANSAITAISAMSRSIPPTIYTRKISNQGVDVIIPPTDRPWGGEMDDLNLSRQIWRSDAPIEWRTHTRPSTSGSLIPDQSRGGRAPSSKARPQADPYARQTLPLPLKRGRSRPQWGRRPARRAQGQHLGNIQTALLGKITPALTPG